MWCQLRQEKGPNSALSHILSFLYDINNMYIGNWITLNLFFHLYNSEDFLKQINVWRIYVCTLFLFEICNYISTMLLFPGTRYSALQRQPSKNEEYLWMMWVYTYIQIQKKKYWILLALNLSSSFTKTLVLSMSRSLLFLCTQTG